MAPYRFDVTWWHEANRAVVSTPLKIFQCPSAFPADRLDDYIDSDDDGEAKTYYASCGDYFVCKGVKKDLADPAKARCTDATGAYIACIDGGKEPETKWVGALDKEETTSTRRIRPRTSIPPRPGSPR
ncbi:hypothetical protein VT84_28185 [Gemmata sp. SH-PL17]|uniref:hypothetical protein n=1 Tax=Gemmata sp. SH-PL17 TaxID=1630693 RepID=UPI0004B50691|nr:hypothetical protein [Gemmata sp. SH-PL17]AMV28315.1 hypothetical protein VT84_28185 [Gemmata sp. SH-PL17]